MRRNLRHHRSRIFILLVTVFGAVTLVACGSMARSEPAIVVQGGDADLGKSLLGQYGCITCHTVPGVRGPDIYVGPPLTAWSERRFIAGTLPNEPDNLVQWIMDPQSIRGNTAMPNLGVTEQDARDIAAYLYSLQK